MIKLGCRPLTPPDVLAYTAVSFRVVYGARPCNDQADYSNPVIQAIG